MQNETVNSDGYTRQEQAGINMINSLHDTFMSWLIMNEYNTTLSADELLYNAIQGDNTHGLGYGQIEYLSAFCILWERASEA